MKILRTAAVATALAAITLTTLPATANAAESNNAIDTGNRNAVVSAYKSRYLPATQSKINWTGSLDGCKPGTQSADSLSKGLSAINFFRGLAKLDSVSLTSAKNASAQQAALMMDANKQLNHNPPSTWKCYTKTGADAAAHGNLYGWWDSAGIGISSAADSVAGYMEDSGSSNLIVGHRRWLLRPETKTMGIGTTKSYNSINVIDYTEQGSATRLAPQWFAYPNAGYFPQQLEPNGRWSLSTSRDYDFTNATITVKNSAGKSLKVTKHAAATWMGPETISWNVDGIAQATGSGEAAYTVTVANVKDENGKPISYTYTTKLIDGTISGASTPTTTPPATPAPAPGPSIRKDDVVTVNPSGALVNYGDLRTSNRTIIGSAWNTMASTNVLDWNADGIEDVLAQHKDGTLYIYVGKKTGGFEPRIRIGGGWQGIQVKVGKLAGTDKVPSIIAKMPNGDLRLYTKTSNSTLSMRKIGGGWNAFSTINLADYNKDGINDILAIRPNGEMMFYRMTPNAGFANESRPVIGRGWYFSEVEHVINFQNKGGEGLLARSSDGKLRYYAVTKNKIVAGAQVGTGWINGFDISGH